VVTEGQGMPRGTLVASAQQSEVRLAEPTLATVKVPRQGGCLRNRPKEVVADKGYDSAAVRQRLRRRGIRPCIPRQKHAAPRRGPKPNRSGSRERWQGERTCAWLGSFRRVHVRWERRLATEHTCVLLAAIVICLRTIVSG